MKKLGKGGSDEAHLVKCGAMTVANASTEAYLGASWPQSNQQVLRLLHCKVYRSFVANEGNDNQQVDSNPMK